MTKQEDVREGMISRLDQILISLHAYDHRNQAERVIDEKFLPFLHGAGVVLKVRGDTTDFIKCPCDDCAAEHKLIDEWGYFCDIVCGQRSHWKSRCRGFQDAAQRYFVESLTEVK